AEAWGDSGEESSGLFGGELLRVVTPRDLIGDARGEAGGDLFLGHAGPAFGAIAGDQGDLVFEAAHDIAGHIIRNDPVAPLAGELFVRVALNLFSLGSKADDEAGALFLLVAEGA